MYFKLINKKPVERRGGEIKQAESQLNKCIEEVRVRRNTQYENLVGYQREGPYCICKLCAAMHMSSQFRSGYPASFCASESNKGRGPASFREASKWSSKWLLGSKSHMLLRHNLL